MNIRTLVYTHVGWLRCINKRRRYFTREIKLDFLISSLLAEKIN